MTLIPTFEEVQKSTAPIWKEYQEDIVWAGIFGSVSRNRAHEESDVDFLILLKPKHLRAVEPVYLCEQLSEACGRETSILAIWQGPDWAWGHMRVEAILSSRTVYGNRADIEHLRREAVAIVEPGLERLKLVAQAVAKIKCQVALIQTFENFIHPDYQSANHECIQEVAKVVKLLDIQPYYHPLRTMLRHSVKHIAAFQDLLDRDNEQGKLWELIQPTTEAIRYISYGSSVGGPKTIRRMLALKRLTDKFEEGEEVDDSMYVDIW